MSAKNSYPELPVIPYKKTTVEMPIVVLFAKSLVAKYGAVYVRMAYAIFRNESANGLKGVNNNYGGIQADVGKWTNIPGKPIATCVKVDSGGVERRFLCFNDDGYKISFELFCIKAKERNMTTTLDYYKKWVGKTKVTEEDLNSGFSKILKQAEAIFN